MGESEYLVMVSMCLIFRELIKSPWKMGFWSITKQNPPAHTIEKHNN